MLRSTSNSWELDAQQAAFEFGEFRKAGAHAMPQVVVEVFLSFAEQERTFRLPPSNRTLHRPASINGRKFPFGSNDPVL
jgi:5-methylthioribose kinase